MPTKDPHTLDLFAVPQPQAPVAGSSDYAFVVSNLVSQELKSCPLDRWEIAAQMSRLSGTDVSKNMIDAWASAAREAHNIPFYRAALLEQVIDSHALTDWMATKRGGRVAYGRDTLNARLGKMLVMKQQLDQQIRQLKKIMNETDADD